MISILLFATLLCPIQIPAGVNRIDVVASYSHEFPAGREYVFRGSSYHAGPADGVITSEGQPWHVAAYAINTDMDTPIQVANCSSRDAIHIDGFESGDTRFW